MARKKDSTGTAPLPPQLETLRVSVVKLGDSLEEAFDSNRKRDSLKYERARYVHALRAISDFLRTNNAPLHYSKRLHRLGVALGDLNEGRTDPLLTPSPTGGVNPGFTTDEWLGRANAALGMAVLAAAGRTRKQAAKAAERVTKMAMGELISSYDQFRSARNKSRIKNSLAREVFEQGYELIEVVLQSAPTAHQALADYFFARATEHLRKQS